MKRRKLIISLLTSAVVLAAAAGLSGCGGSNSAPTTAAESTEAATAAESTETATETEESTEAETTEPETESVDSSEEETANEDAVDPAAVREYWNGNWFGGYLIDHCTDAFTEVEGYWWDCLATIEVNDDNTGVFRMWDSEMSKEMPSCLCNVTFGKGSADYGCMNSEKGTFWYVENNIGKGDWKIDPAVSAYASCEHLICIEGTYQDDEGSFMYHVFLKPWGMTWDDVKAQNENLMPFYYDWYLGKKDGEMPLAIGE